MERKQFIKTGCLLCVGATAGLSSLTLLQGCATGKIVKQEPVNNQLSVNTALFTTENPYLILRTKTLNFDILVHKKTETEYVALYMQCTHYDNPVFANKKEIFCPSHGSKFNFDGEVTKEPANIPLKKFPTQLTNNTLTISINS